MLSKANRKLQRAATLALMGAAFVVSGVALQGCNPGNSSNANAATSGAPPVQPPPPPNTGGQTAAKPTSRPKFDGQAAFVHLKKQCDFGPRVVGSTGHEKCADYLSAEMKKYADEIVVQETTYRGMPVKNIIGVFYPAGSKTPSANPVLIFSHWDTRPIADGPFSTVVRSGVPYRFGAKGWNRTNPIPGASDGASGGAILLELAKMFKQQKPNVGVLLMFVDGEDYGDFTAKDHQGDGVFLGSRYFAKNYQKNKALGQPAYGILLDMVGAKNLILPREATSDQFARQVNDRIYGAAQKLGYGSVFLANEAQNVEDDHVPLNQEGIPTVDLIHPLPFGNYERTGLVQWHTLQDSPENCSPKSLQTVGETLAEVIYYENSSN